MSACTVITNTQDMVDFIGRLCPEWDEVHCDPLNTKRLHDASGYLFHETWPGYTYHCLFLLSGPWTICNHSLNNILLSTCYIPGALFTKDNNKWDSFHRLRYSQTYHLGGKEKDLKDRTYKSPPQGYEHWTRGRVEEDKKIGLGKTKDSYLKQTTFGLGTEGWIGFWQMGRKEEEVNSKLKVQLRKGADVTKYGAS